MLLTVKNLCKSYPDQQSWFLKRRKKSVLQDVSFTLQQGECIGIVGESGSGKSTLGKILLGLEPYDSGSVIFSPELQALPRTQALSVVFQNYNTSVNPRMTIAQIIAEPLQNQGISKDNQTALIITLLQEVGLTASFMTRYPHQLSGGQLQRVCIARAVAPNPQFILLDEAVSSLDVSVQVTILELLLQLKQHRNIAYLFITHDIAVASFICDRLLFFKEGRIVEQIDDINHLSKAKDPYTKQLLNAARYLDIPFALE